MANGREVKFKIKGMPSEKEYNAMPFGRQIEYRHQIEDFKATAKIGHVSQKRVSPAKALREFIKLNDVEEYYLIRHTAADYYDDTYQIWYKTKEVAAE